MSLVWYGFYDAVASPNSTPTTATFSIDGNTPTPFTLGLNGVSANPPQLSQSMFTISGLPFGEHRIEVIYQGDPNGTPLSVESILLGGTSLSAIHLNQSVEESPSTTSIPQAVKSGIPVIKMPVNNSTVSAPRSTVTAPPSTLGLPKSTVATPGPIGTGSLSITRHGSRPNISLIVGLTTVGAQFFLIASLGLLWHCRQKRSQHRNTTVDGPYSELVSSSTAIQESRLAQNNDTRTSEVVMDTHLEENTGNRTSDPVLQIIIPVDSAVWEWDDGFQSPDSEPPPAYSSTPASLHDMT